MTSKRAIGVLAEPPLAGRCKTQLLAAHPPEWVSALYAAMLRDTLDGLQAVSAEEYLVFVGPAPAGAAAHLDVVERHVPAPWRLVTIEQECGDLGARVEHALSSMFARGVDYALLSIGDAPSFPTEPLEAALAGAATKDRVLVCPTEAGGYYVVGMSKPEPRLFRDIPWGTPAVMEATRLRAAELGLTLRELPKGYVVDEPSDVLLLMEELRRNPERAPRTAQFLITNA